VGAEPKLEMRQLDVEECLELLEAGTHGRLAFLSDGQPDILPVNYRFHGGAVVFRTGRGRLLDIIHLTSAAFEIDAVAGEGAWSVIVRGKAEEATDPADLEQLRELPLQPWASGERDHYLRILPRSITGRRLG
jgi:uncharacterized protein